MAAGLLSRREFEIHPDGPAVLTFKDYELKEGKFGMQLIWKFESQELREEDNKPFEPWYYTDTTISASPKNKLVKILRAFGFTDAADWDDERLNAFDIDDLLGQRVQAMFVHAKDSTGVLRSNIDSITPLRTRRPRPADDSVAAGNPNPPSAPAAPAQRPTQPVAEIGKASDPEWDDQDE